MANYIKNELLCEAYSHLDVSIANDPIAKEKLKSEMRDFFVERAKFLFGSEVNVEIEFEDGSLITKLKVVGSAATAILFALNSYGTFRQTVDYLAKDSTYLAQSANLEMVFRTKAAYCDRIRIEKRKGIFGRVDELLGSLDSVNRFVSESVMPRTNRAITGFESASTDQLLEWNKKAEILFSKLEHDDTKACIAAGLLEELEKFPSTTPWEKELDTKSFRATLIDSDPKQAGLLAGAAARYTRTVLSIRKQYSDAVKQYAPTNS